MRRAALLAAFALALGRAAGGRDRRQDCPKTTLGDIEDEVMCPVCGTPLGLASEAPQAQRERAYIERLIAQLQVEGPDQAARWSPSSATACSPCRATRATTSFGDVLVYVVPALGMLLAAGGIAFAVVRWRAAAVARRPRWPALAGADGLATRRRHGALRPVIAAAVGRRHDLRRLRRRLHLVRLPLRAAARARLPLDDLGRLVRRHPGGPRAAPGARARAPVLPRVHGDVRRARHDRHRPRPDASGPPRACCARSPGS